MLNNPMNIDIDSNYNINESNQINNTNLNTNINDTLLNINNSSLDIEISNQTERLANTYLMQSNVNNNPNNVLNQNNLSYRFMNQNFSVEERTQDFIRVINSLSSFNSDNIISNGIY